MCLFKRSIVKDGSRWIEGADRCCDQRRSTVLHDDVCFVLICYINRPLVPNQSPSLLLFAFNKVEKRIVSTAKNELAPSRSTVFETYRASKAISYAQVAHASSQPPDSIPSHHRGVCHSNVPEEQDGLSARRRSGNVPSV